MSAPVRAVPGPLTVVDVEHVITYRDCVLIGRPHSAAVVCRHCHAVVATIEDPAHEEQTALMAALLPAFEHGMACAGHVAPANSEN